MKLKVKSLNLRAGKPVAFISEKDARKLQVHVSERLRISTNGNKVLAVVNILKGFTKQGEIVLSQNIVKSLNLKSRDKVDVDTVERPMGAKIIKDRIKCEPYTKSQLKKIMSDIVSGALTEAEIAYFVSGVYHCGMSIDEIADLTWAIYHTGHKLRWGKDKKIVDKHSIGGIPGNRTTPIVVSICAAAGVIMPKTSSRAITSPSGTADTVESIAKVTFTEKRLKEIVRKTNACLVWGGALGLAPADDKLIQVEKILSVDPQPQLIASIMAKKLSAGSKYVLIDIPYGLGAKVSRKEATDLKKKFTLIGRKLKLKVQVVLTDGSQPIGNGIGPMPEMRDIVRVLKRDESPKDLEDKSILLSSMILEMVGKAKKGQGKKLAKKILNSGEAFKKFEEIIKAQEGSIKNLRYSKYSKAIRASTSGKIYKIVNKDISYLTKLTGCPADKTAGIYIYKHRGQKLKKGEKIVMIHSDSKRKLNESIEFFKTAKPIKIR